MYIHMHELCMHKRWQIAKPNERELVSNDDRNSQIRKFETKNGKLWETQNIREAQLTVSPLLQ